MQVDLTPVIVPMVGLAATSVSIVGTWALVKLAQKLGVQTTAVQTATFENAINKAATAGLNAELDRVKQKGWDHPDVKSASVAFGLNYALAKFPDAIAAETKGKDVNSVVKDELNRAFPIVADAVAASPATPPADLTMATAPEQDPAPMQAIAGADGFGKPFVDPTIATLTSAVTNLIASHETTNALLGKLVDQGGGKGPEVLSAAGGALIGAPYAPSDGASAVLPAQAAAAPVAGAATA